MSTYHIESYLREQILVLDGAMGTALATAKLNESDFGGSDYVGCSEILNVTRPDLITEVHSSYIEAGAHFLTTNTFGANKIVLSEYGLEQRVAELNDAAVMCIKAALEQTEHTQPCFIVGDLGPSSKAYSVTGGISLDEITEAYYEQAVSLLEAGVDIFMFETVQDVLNLKAAHRGIEKAFDKVKKRIPIWISVTIESTQTTLAGQTIEAFYTAIEHLQPLIVGMNCALGPEHLRADIQKLSSLATTYISFHPNAGLPDEDGSYKMTPTMFYEEIQPLLEARCLNIVGGCCGTSAVHIMYISQRLQAYTPHVKKKQPTDFVSGLIQVSLADFTIVGERTNTIGSKIFRELIAENKFEKAVEIARLQVQSGAQILDVCLANPDRDEIADMLAFVRALRQSVKVPLMIDTTNIDVLLTVLPEIPGKMIVNSVNFERGDAYVETYLQIAKRHGAKVIVGLIDEEGMAVSYQKKITLFDRLQRTLESLNFPKSDIIIDPLVFPIATGDENYINAAKITLDAIQTITRAGYYTVLGLSNISFGLPPAGRLYINDVYLEMAKRAGLSMALVNAAHHAFDDQIARKYAKELIKSQTPAHIDQFVSYIRTLAPVQKKEVEVRAQTPEEMLEDKVITGTKLYVHETIQQLLDQGWEPLAIINGPLMKGMDEVGVRFGRNELIVTEVLQSASVMKKSVAYLEPFLSAEAKTKRGTVLLATVKGDVHDIGKNLVGIILENNGYNVIDLGINVPTAKMIEAVQVHQPDLIGLSGLLVKSAQQMVEVVSAFDQQGITIPVLIGGAALTRRFVATKIAKATRQPVFYCRDAMVGLDIANQLQSERRDLCIQSTIEAQSALCASVAGEIKNQEDERVSVDFTSRLGKRKAPSDFDVHIVRPSFEEVYPYVNEPVLFSRHFGMKNGSKHPQYTRMKQRLSELIARYADQIELRAIFQMYPITKKGESIYVDGTDVQFQFPRQQAKARMALQDFMHKRDALGFFVATAGDAFFQIAKAMEADGDYEGAHMMRSLNLELAEAMAEYTHAIMRGCFDIEDENLSYSDILKAKYTGKRYSFGYHACPDLNDQKKLFTLLEPEKIGVHLSESMMMSPLASVSAIVLYNEKATYFVVEV